MISSRQDEEFSEELTMCLGLSGCVGFLGKDFCIKNICLSYSLLCFLLLPPDILTDLPSDILRNVTVSAFQVKDTVETGVNGIHASHCFSLSHSTFAVSEIGFWGAKCSSSEMYMARWFSLEVLPHEG